MRGNPAVGGGAQALDCVSPLPAAVSFSMTRVPNPQVRPTCGYVFTDAKGVSFTAADEDGLVAVVARYRAVSGEPPGEPRKEIQEYLCRRSPATCIGRVAPSVPVNEKQLLAHVTHFVSRLALKPETFQPVSDSEAARRAQICAGCSANVSWVAICQNCTVAVGPLVEKISRHVKLEPKLAGRACAKAMDDLQLATRMAGIEQSRPVSKVPECWRSKL